VWAIEDGTLRRQRLVNDRVVSEESRELTPDEIQRVRTALGRADLPTLAGGAVRPVEANLGKLVIEADGERWETAYRKGAPPAESAADSPDARLRGVADTLRALGEGR
jgi:hypothetical protein